MKVDDESLELLSDCQANGTSVIFSANKTDIVFQTKILEVNKDYVALANKVPPNQIKKVMTSTNFGLQSKMVRFQSNSLDTDGVNLIFALDKLNRIEETRQAERFPFDADERVICELRNPYDGETILSKVVLDMSATGVSLRSSKESELFSEGMLFNDIRVMIDGEPYTKTSAKVVYTRRLMDQSGKLRVQVGLKFESANPS